MSLAIAIDCMCVLRPRDRLPIVPHALLPFPNQEAPMPDAAPVVHIGENSPERIAYKLMDHIATVEKKIMFHTRELEGRQTVDRQWILDTYAECLQAVQGKRP